MKIKINENATKYLRLCESLMSLCLMSLVRFVLMETVGTEIRNNVPKEGGNNRQMWGIKYRQQREQFCLRFVMMKYTYSIFYI